jgi:6-phosphofructo-2-kinase/fructose-2,6-biphosphatase 2
MDIFISRHGESFNNVHNIIGGDSNITKKGIKYSNILKTFFKNKNKPVIIWTSKLKRTVQTAKQIEGIKKEFNEINEIYSGDFEGLSLENIKKEYPTQYKLRNDDKLNNSYPNGESYLNLKKRVYKLFEKINIDENKILLIIAHQAVCRVLYSYFTTTPLNECINIKIDLHTLYKLEKNNFIPVPIPI